MPAPHRGRETETGRCRQSDPVSQRCSSTLRVPGSMFVFTFEFKVRCSGLEVRAPNLELCTMNTEPERRTRTWNLEPGTRNGTIHRLRVLPCVSLTSAESLRAARYG